MITSLTRTRCATAPFRHGVIVGEHEQLPPFALSQEVKDVLGCSFFERIETHLFIGARLAMRNPSWERKILSVDTPVRANMPLGMSFLVDTQHRRVPQIAAFPCDLVYGGKVLNGPVRGNAGKNASALYSVLKSLFEKATSPMQLLMFVDTDMFHTNTSRERNGPSLE